MFACEYNLFPSDHKNLRKPKLKLYTLKFLCITTTCVLMYRDLGTSESFTQEVVFQVIPLYVQILITLIGNIIQNSFMGCCTSGYHRKKNTKLIHLAYWTLTFMSLIPSNWLRMSNHTTRMLPEKILQIFLCFTPLFSVMHYCRMCAEFQNEYRSLNKLVLDEFLTTKKLLAIRTERKRLNDRVGKMAGGRAFGAQILSEIGMTAITIVFRIHRALRSTTERFGSTVTSEESAAADLLDVLHRVLRLYALCKVSGDITKEANEIVKNLLNINPSTDTDLENEISFFLWEIDNPPSEVRLVYGTFALGPRLFVSVFSWCIGYILILLQFRWPTTR